MGYAASLPLQERLITRTTTATRGQALGLNGTGLLAFQGIGAVCAGTLAQLLGSGPAAAERRASNTILPLRWQAGIAFGRL